ncbi:SDR family NAD(P)-dependent oxidoreductase [Desulfitobacterium dichloroeliminans]|nr:SDR family oxidoreductase [Desulfitobacterium dichloroeliminans]
MLILNRRKKIKEETAMLLKGKNAVITGCLRGIGNKTMEVFAKEGANIWACCQREDAELEKQIQQLSEQFGVWIKPIYFDLTDPESIKLGLKSIMADKKPIDALVNIAGMTHNALFHMTSMNIMKTVFEVDFFSQMQISQFVTKLMARNKRGSVINISSIAGLDGNAGQLAYSAAKGALISATKTMAQELAASDIRVNAVAPGVIDTTMTRSLSDVVKAGLIQPCELKRLGTDEEVANTIVFLASDLSSFVTGQVIRVDGGIG